MALLINQPAIKHRIPEKINIKLYLTLLFSHQTRNSLLDEIDNMIF